MKTEDLQNGSDSEDDADFDQVESNPPSDGKFNLLFIKNSPKSWLLTKTPHFNVFTESDAEESQSSGSQQRRKKLHKGSKSKQTDRAVG